MKQQDSSSSIKVYIRVRPLVQQQLGSQQIVTVQPDGKTINITQDALSKLSIKFDQALPNQSTQREVYNLLSEYVRKITQGFNLTVFAYGQTGSGKTYTMFGKDWQGFIENKKISYQNTFFEDIETDENFAGLTPRAIYQLFREVGVHQQQKNKFNVYCSFMQIYNQKIYDLLQDFQKPKALNLHESPADGTFVQGLAEYNITHYLDCLQLMKRGQKNRIIRQTSMNTKSSRSHTIFQILLQSKEADHKGMFKKARLNLCDLAGSQKVNKNEAMNDQHFKELKNINQSLSTLGKVIANLSSKSKNIPAFRESKLTRLLKDSLTANTFTFIIGNISPSNFNTQQTMNTLKFVQRARHIVMKVKPTVFNGQNLEVVNKLQKQIQYLKELLNLKRKGITPDDLHTRLIHLQSQNQKLKKTSVSYQDVEKLIEQNRIMKQEIHKLQMTQYALSDDPGDTKSQMSLNSLQQSEKLSVFQERKNSHGFALPDTKKKKNSQSNMEIETNLYSPTKTKKSLMSAGKNSLDSFSSMNKSGGMQEMKKQERTKQKQKILSRLEELQRIQKFNEEKLMRDLQQLQKKNNMQLNKIVDNRSPKKKTSFGDMKPPSSRQKSPSNKVDYEQRIRQLQAKLFGK